MALPKGLGGFRRLMREYRRMAKKRGIRFELSEAEFIKLSTSNCFYCGRIPRLKRKQFKDTSWVPPSNGIDRVRNSGHYISGNVVPCCQICNSGKNKFTLTEFLKWVGQIYAKHKAYFAFQKDLENKGREVAD